MVDVKSFVRNRWKSVLCGAIALTFFSNASFAVQHKECVDIPEAIESINRIELEDWEPDIGIIRSDGTVNRVVLWSKAEYCAKVLYGTARTNSEDQQETVIWCIINRLENSQYPNTIEGVCGQPQQFMGYAIDNPIIEDFAQLAYRVLYSYYVDGYKPVSKDFVFMSASQLNITLRNTFETQTRTEYWHVA